MSGINTHPMKQSTIMRISYDRNIIDTSPGYQRSGDIWNEEKKQLLMDSILNDYDIPKIYFHALSKSKKLPDGREVLFAIIDGRQRIETIWGFIDGKFPLAEDFKYQKDPKIKAGGLTYKDLATEYPQLKVMFDSFSLPIICVETDDIDLIEDMFSRLNEAVPLNAAEKRNAFGGPMIGMINEVSYNEFFKTKVKFKNNRYQHKEVAARILYLEDTYSNYRKIFDTKKAYLDYFVKSFKTDSNLNASIPANEVKKVLNKMNNIFVEKDDLLMAQAGVPLYFLLFKLAINQGRLDNITRKRLVEFNEKVAENRRIAERDISKADFELLEFDRMSVQGTNDASSIKERLQIISKFFGIKNLTYV